MHSIASCAVSMLTAALTPALVPASLMRLISSLTARATTGASNGSSGIHASFAGGGAAFATVTGAGFSLLAQPIAMKRSRGPNCRPSRLDQIRRPVSAIL